MVDCASFRKKNPYGYLFYFRRYMLHPLEDVPMEELHLCAPTVLGYSFSARKWGRLVPDKFSEVVWNKQAYEGLVLSEEKKTLIKSLVMSDRERIVTDVVF